MNKEESYFKFGLLLTLIVIVLQFLLMIISKTFKYAFPDIFILSAPTVITIIISFIFYKKKRCFLKVEQYLLSLMPIALFLSSSLAVGFKEDLNMNIFNVLIFLFLTFYTLSRVIVYQLIVKFKDELIAKRLSVQTLFYLISYSLLMGMCVSLMFNL